MGIVAKLQPLIGDAIPDIIKIFKDSDNQVQGTCAEVSIHGN